MTIQEIYDKLNARAAAFQMPFSVKGGIPGERVVFEAGAIRFEVRANVEDFDYL